MRDQKDSAVIVASLQKRHCFTAKTAHFSVGENRLQAIAHFDPILPVIGREKNQHAARLLFGSHAPLGRQIDCKLLDGLIAQGRNGYDSDLRLGLLLDFAAKRSQSFPGRRAQHSREIAHIALGLEVLYLLRKEAWRNKNQKQ